MTVDEETRGMIHEISRDEIGAHKQDCLENMQVKFIANPPIWSVVMACLVFAGAIGGGGVAYYQIESGVQTSLAVHDKSLTENEKKIVKLESALDEIQNMKKVAEETNRETKAMREDIKELLKQGNR